MRPQPLPPQDDAQGHSFSNRYDRMVHTVVADSGYGSEENYRFMSENGMEDYVKYNYYLPFE